MASERLLATSATQSEQPVPRWSRCEGFAARGKRDAEPTFAARGGVRGAWLRARGKRDAEPTSKARAAGRGAGFAARGKRDAEPAMKRAAAGGEAGLRSARQARRRAGVLARAAGGEAGLRSARPARCSGVVARAVEQPAYVGRGKRAVRRVRRRDAVGDADPAVLGSDAAQARRRFARARGGRVEASAERRSLTRAAWTASQVEPTVLAAASTSSAAARGGGAFAPRGQKPEPGARGRKHDPRTTVGRVDPRKQSGPRGGVVDERAPDPRASAPFRGGHKQGARGARDEQATRSAGPSPTPSRGARKPDRSRKR